MIFSSLISSYYYLSRIKKPTCDNGFLLDLFCNENKIKAIIISIICIFITLFSSNNFIILLGCEDIRIMPEGTYCYYVYATNEKNNTYTLPANIQKTDGKYFVHNVYFNNGGYLYFSDGDFFDFDEDVAYFDQNNNEWSINLTANKTSHSKVKEKNPLQIGWLLAVFVFVISLTVSCIFYIISIDRKKKFQMKLAIKNQLIKRTPNGIPMTEEDIGLVHSWDDYIGYLQMSRDQIKNFLIKYPIEEIRDAYNETKITDEQYKTSRNDIEEMDMLYDMINKKLDDIIENQNQLIDRYYN